MEILKWESCFFSDLKGKKLIEVLEKKKWKFRFKMEVSLKLR